MQPAFTLPARTQKRLPILSENIAGVFVDGLNAVDDLFLFGHHFSDRLNNLFHIGFTKIIAVTGIGRLVIFTGQGPGRHIQ